MYTLTFRQVIAACSGPQSERKVSDGWKQNLAELWEGAW
jgi:hypothetical protein